MDQVLSNPVSYSEGLAILSCHETHYKDCSFQSRSHYLQINSNVSNAYLWVN